MYMLHCFSKWVSRQNVKGRGQIGSYVYFTLVNKRKNCISFFKKVVTCQFDFSSHQLIWPSSERTGEQMPGSSRMPATRKVGRLDLYTFNYHNMPVVFFKNLFLAQSTKMSVESFIFSSFFAQFSEISLIPPLN